MDEPDCAICAWIKELREEHSPFLVKELTTGFAVISKYQYEFYRGYCLFLYKHHKTELHELEDHERQMFLDEMSQVARAIYGAVHQDKMNYEMLGNGEPHMHWHLIPRFKADLEFTRAIWLTDKNVRQAADTYPAPEQLKTLRENILARLS